MPLEFPSHGGGAAGKALSRHCIKGAFVGRKRKAEPKLGIKRDDPGATPPPPRSGPRIQRE